MWIKNAWYVAGWASELTREKPLGRVFLNEPVVLYRTEKGDAVALEDRCCHRLAPLSMGRIEGDQLRCMYHGLRFDPSGACTEIPGQDRIPPSMKVRSFPLVQKQNLLWIWMGDPALARESDILDWPYLDHPGWSYKPSYLHYKANYLLIVDNLLDFSHLSFVHENTIGSMSLAETRAQIDRTPFGLKITRILDNDVPPAFVKKLRNVGERVDRWNIYDWHARGNILAMDSGFAPLGTGGHAGKRENAVEFRHLSVQTPETETTTHYFFGHPQALSPGNVELDEMLLKTVTTAFVEDKDMIEAQQRMIEKDSNARMQAIVHDSALFQGRRIIESLIEGSALAAE
jgi:phenylpropionate dioxygenase-like ring-hydroxylating dioxygenase large terminal subunit